MDELKFIPTEHGYSKEESEMFKKISAEIVASFKKEKAKNPDAKMQVAFDDVLKTKTKDVSDKFFEMFLALVEFDDAVNKKLGIGKHKPTEKKPPVKKDNYSFLKIFCLSKIFYYN